MRKLFRYAGRYKIYLFLAPILIIGEVVMETFIPQLIARLINLISAADETPIDMGELLKLGGLMILMAFLSLGFGASSARAASVGAMGFSRNLRHALFLLEREEYLGADKPPDENQQYIHRECGLEPVLITECAPPHRAGDE